MKECPVCHRRYDDSLKFCTVDGHQLEILENDTTDSANDKSTVKDTSNKKNVWKKILKTTVLSLIGIALAFGAFYNYYTNAATYLRTEPSNLCVPKKSGSYDIDIDFDGYVWEVNYHSDWIHVLKRKNSISVTIGRNTTGRVREGSITIKSGKQVAQVTIKQNAYATLLRAGETSLAFSKDGGLESMSFESDGSDYDIETPSWINAYINDKQLKVKCDSNSDEYRTGYIVLKEDNLRWSINVTQGGKCNICHGEGKVSCFFCGGSGGSGFGMYYIPCASCGGRGFHTCGTCNGTGERD